MISLLLHESEAKLRMSVNYIIYRHRIHIWTMECVYRKHAGMIHYSLHCHMHVYHIIPSYNSILNNKHINLLLPQVQSTMFS